VTSARVLRWRQAAVDDLAAIVLHIESDAPIAAARFRDAIVAKIHSLAEFPLTGSICHESPSARVVVFGNYLVYYTVSRREIMIRAVVHGARLFRPSWLRRK
jgi:plasmid stabilization system protein ParE